VNVFAVPVGADGCGYYRSFLPLSHLGRHGHNTSLPPRGMTWLPDAELQGDMVDVLAGQLVSGPRGMALWEEWAGHAGLVYDIDDDIFSVTYPMSPFYQHPEFVTISQYLIAMSDLVTVATPRLAEIVSELNPNVTVLPNCVHADLLTIDRPRRDRVTVGWTPSPSHLEDADYIAPMLRRFLRRNPAVDFHVIGFNYLATMETPGRHTMWVDDLWDYYRLIDFDIGIAPLAPSRFNRSKSALKALEYAALGIPVVASDLEPYRDFILDGVTGYLVKHDHEWEKRLRELVNDDAMRTEMGAKAREHAAAFTIQEHWADWERAYAHLVP
jgi:glycosyltransferase involved in cell wall biosynthesis